MNVPSSTRSIVILRWCSIGLMAVALSLAAWAGSRHWQIPRTVSGGEGFDVRRMEEEPLDLITDHSNICEVHGVEMTVGARPVVYGLLDGRSTVRNLHMIAHPHAAWPYAGGCIVKSLPIARAYLCPQCVVGAGPIPPDAIFADLAETTPSPILPPSPLDTLEAGMQAMRIDAHGPR